jgi:glucose-1-phosphate cytidylyltransferase
VENDESIWEKDPVRRLAQDGQLVGYRHYGFLSCMDTFIKKKILQDLWVLGKAPWMIW